MFHWFGTAPMGSLQDITPRSWFVLWLHKTCFAIWPKSHYQLALKLTVLIGACYQWTSPVHCCYRAIMMTCQVMRSMLLKIASLDIHLIIMEFPRIFNVNWVFVWANSYLNNRWLQCTKTWYGKLLRATDWFSAVIFHGPNFSRAVCT